MPEVSVVGNRGGSRRREAPRRSPSVLVLVSGPPTLSRSTSARHAAALFCLCMYETYSYLHSPAANSGPPQASAQPRCPDAEEEEEEPAAGAAAAAAAAAQ